MEDLCDHITNVFQHHDIYLWRIDDKNLLFTGFDNDEINQGIQDLFRDQIDSGLILSKYRILDDDSVLQVIQKIIVTLFDNAFSPENVNSYYLYSYNEEGISIPLTINYQHKKGSIPSQFKPEINTDDMPFDDLGVLTNQIGELMSSFNLNVQDLDPSDIGMFNCRLKIIYGSSYQTYRDHSGKNLEKYFPFYYDKKMTPDIIQELDEILNVNDVFTDLFYNQALNTVVKNIQDIITMDPDDLPEDRLDFKDQNFQPYIKFSRCGIDNVILKVQPPNDEMNMATDLFDLSKIFNAYHANQSVPFIKYLRDKHSEPMFKIFNQLTILPTDSLSDPISRISSRTSSQTSSRSSSRNIYMKQDEIKNWIHTSSDQKLITGKGLSFKKFIYTFEDKPHYIDIILFANGKIECKSHWNDKIDTSYNESIILVLEKITEFIQEINLFSYQLPGIPSTMKYLIPIYTYDEESNLYSWDQSTNLGNVELIMMNTYTINKPIKLTIPEIEHVLKRLKTFVNVDQKQGGLNLRYKRVSNYVHDHGLFKEIDLYKEAGMEKKVILDKLRDQFLIDHTHAEYIYGKHQPKNLMVKRPGKDLNITIYDREVKVTYLGILKGHLQYLHLFISRLLNYMLAMRDKENELGDQLKKYMQMDDLELEPDKSTGDLKPELKSDSESDVDVDVDVEIPPTVKKRESEITLKDNYNNTEINNEHENFLLRIKEYKVGYIDPITAKPYSKAKVLKNSNQAFFNYLHHVVKEFDTKSAFAQANVSGATLLKPFTSHHSLVIISYLEAKRLLKDTYIKLYKLEKNVAKITDKTDFENFKQQKIKIDNRIIGNIKDPEPILHENPDENQRLHKINWLKARINWLNNGLLYKNYWYFCPNEFIFRNEDGKISFFDEDKYHSIWGLNALSDDGYNTVPSLYYASNDSKTPYKTRYVNFVKRIKLDNDGIYCLGTCQENRPESPPADQIINKYDCYGKVSESRPHVSSIPGKSSKSSKAKETISSGHIPTDDKKAELLSSLQPYFDFPEKSDKLKFVLYGVDNQDNFLSVILKIVNRIANKTLELNQFKKLVIKLIREDRENTLFKYLMKGTLSTIFRPEYSDDLRDEMEDAYQNSLDIMARDNFLSYLEMSVSLDETFLWELFTYPGVLDRLIQSLQARRPLDKVHNKKYNIFILENKVVVKKVSSLSDIKDDESKDDESVASKSKGKQKFHEQTIQIHEVRILCPISADLDTMYSFDSDSIYILKHIGKDGNTVYLPIPLSDFEKYQFIIPNTNPYRMISDRFLNDIILCKSRPNEKMRNEYMNFLYLIGKKDTLEQDPYNLKYDPYSATEIIFRINHLIGEFNTSEPYLQNFQIEGIVQDTVNSISYVKLKNQVCLPCLPSSRISNKILNVLTSIDIHTTLSTLIVLTRFSINLVGLTPLQIIIKPDMDNLTDQTKDQAIGFLLYNGQIVVFQPILISKIKNKDHQIDLPVLNFHSRIPFSKYLLSRDEQLIMYDPADINRYILTNDETPDKRRIYSVRLNYENESFQRMRYELSKFFNVVDKSDEHDLELEQEDGKESERPILDNAFKRKHIEDLIENTSDRKLLRKTLNNYLTDIFNKILTDEVPDDLENSVGHLDMGVEDSTYDFTTDFRYDYVVRPFRYECLNPKLDVLRQDKDLHCDNHHLYVNSINLITGNPTNVQNYIERITEELIRNPYKRYEILYDSVDYSATNIPLINENEYLINIPLISNMKRIDLIKSIIHNMYNTKNIDYRSRLMDDYRVGHEDPELNIVNSNLKIRCTQLYSHFRSEIRDGLREMDLLDYTFIHHKNQNECLMKQIYDLTNRNEAIKSEIVYITENLPDALDISDISVSGTYNPKDICKKDYKITLLDLYIISHLPIRDNNNLNFFLIREEEPWLEYYSPILNSDHSSPIGRLNFYIFYLDSSKQLYLVQKRINQDHYQQKFKFDDLNIVLQNKYTTSISEPDPPIKEVINDLKSTMINLDDICNPIITKLGSKELELKSELELEQEQDLKPDSTVLKSPKPTSIESPKPPKPTIVLKSLKPISSKTLTPASLTKFTLKSTKKPPI